MRSSLGALLVLCLAGCGVELEHGLDERQANQIAAVLDEHGIEAHKARDEGADGYKVTVARDDLARAFRVLESYDLPKRGRRGVGEALADRGLLPSLSEERARIEAARAAELERTLEVIPGVVAARVHLALPDLDRLDGRGAPARASVLLRTEPQAAIDAAQVRALVVGATAGLSPEAVQVVVTGGRAPPQVSSLEPVGPLRVARGERGRVVAIAASGLVLLLLLGAALVATALRLSAARPRHSPSKRSG